LPNSTVIFAGSGTVGMKAGVTPNGTFRMKGNTLMCSRSSPIACASARPRVSTIVDSWAP